MSKFSVRFMCKISMVYKKFHHNLCKIFNIRYAQILSMLCVQKSQHDKFTLSDAATSCYV